MGLPHAGDHRRRYGEESIDDLINEYIVLTDRLVHALIEMTGQIARDHVRQAAPFKTAYEAKKARNDRLEAAKAVIWARNRRNLHFGDKLFEDPNWDMLLDLYAANLEGRKVSVSSLTIAANVPATTALRHITLLEQQGDIEREPDPADKRRSFVRLSNPAKQRMENWINEIVEQRA